MSNYPIHPACALWPRPSDEEVTAIAESIKAEGLLNPIWLFEGAILDGKTRYEACGIAGVEPRFETYTGTNPIKFSIAQNRERRHMNDVDLTFIVADLCKLPQYIHGRNNKQGLMRPCLSEEKTTAELAKEAGIGRSNLVAAKTVLKNGEPNIIKMVRDSKVGFQSAAYFVRANSRNLQQEATVSQVKDSRKSGRREPKITIAVPQEDVIDKLRPLVKRVKEQSKRHAATVSFVELARIAHELGELADAWMKSGLESGTLSTPAPIGRVRER